MRLENRIDISKGKDQTILTLKSDGELILFVPKSDYSQLLSKLEEKERECEKYKLALSRIKTKPCDVANCVSIADEALSASGGNDVDGL